VKVKELIEKLNTLNPELDVWVAADQEGNAFNDLEFVYTSAAWRDGFEQDTVHPDDVEDYTEEELFEVVVIWP
jgi:hypothetical protein